MTDMTLNHSLKANPLFRFGHIDGVARTDGIPIPLKSERMRIVVRGALALVSREQIFRNDEDSTIEATITFPVPIHATLHRLTAKVGGRTLAAAAQPRERARETYETAIDDGRTAVLHEELVRGIHMLSIAHIPPGTEIAVTHSWISAMSPRGAARAFLRVPVTVGDVYGDSPFTDADDLIVSRDVVHEAVITVDAGSAVALLGGSPLTDGETRVRLDAAIDLEISGGTDAPALGVSADGRTVAVSVAPDVEGHANISAVVLVDHSGSMGEVVSSKAGTKQLTKHAAVAAGLIEATQKLRPQDRIELWQFDSTVERLSDAETPLSKAISRLDEPCGGTEIGAALCAVVATSPATDVILITDGLSHALDVQALANSGCRFTVVLIGEDSFEPNVGRLAALTGGQIVLAVGASDAAAAVRAAIDSVRRPKAPFKVETWPLDKVATHAGGAVIEATWGRSGAQAGEPDFAAAVGALAAAMALPHLREDQAVKVAVDHGIVCHLTSLVLVDETGLAQEGLPAHRKVPLMVTARSASADLHFEMLAESTTSVSRLKDEMTTSVGRLKEQSRVFFQRAQVATSLSSPPPSLSAVAKEINWSADPEALRRGDVSKLRPEIAQLIIAASKAPEIVSLVSPHRTAIAVVIALVARSLCSSDRAAARIARAVLVGLGDDAVAKAMTALGLRGPSGLLGTRLRT
jgi:hypothetical protein